LLFASRVRVARELETMMRPALLRLACVALLLPLAPLPALALSATAASNLNVRSGPGADFAVVSKLQAGDIVDVSKCEGTFCLVTHGTASGWVSASFLTRDTVAKPAMTATAPAAATATAPAEAAVKPTTPQVAAAKPVVPSVAGPAKPAALPQVASAKPGLPQPLTTKPAVPQVAAVKPAPQVAAAKPAPQIAAAKPSVTQPLPSFTIGAKSDFPPAFDTSSDPAPVLDDNQSPEIADIGIPRPRADVPLGALTGPDDEDPGFTLPAPLSADVFAGDTLPRVGRFGRLHRFQHDWTDYAALGAGDVCFLAGARSAFCLSAGESLSDLGRWSGQTLDLRNPDGLPVSICSGPDRDCQLYQSSASTVVDERDFDVTIRVGGVGR
jgi:uncharacterized protein YraI